MTSAVVDRTVTGRPPAKDRRPRRPLRWSGAARLVVAIVAAVLSLFPFAFMALSSLKTRSDFLDRPFGLPRELTLANFTGLFSADFGRYFVNSIVIAAVTVTGTVVLAILAAYPLSRFRTRLNTPMMLLFLAGIMVPVHVTLIPIYVLTQQLTMYDSIAALFGPFIAFNLPMAVFVLASFFRQIPEALFEAARIDGAGHWRILRNVVMPVSGPAISTVGIITFIFVWNEFVFALVLLSSQPNYPLPLGLNAFYGQFSVNIPGMMAALTLATIPSILFYLLAQERVVSGLAAGALRGE
ncbi:carbohydrate ABC transporter permease [Micromonospora sp. WMMD882]|uniref:carbohydrate ABC transporter permease n=1 Tax=Micromonospora sp. WMMD882 TaxID=3015151 RepID=UPI00248B3993|nr:carbohydrate ABC transporter permease [Micromonospora sp. WMMD882]WBB80327.1 carbohydrate ABC transporter permease [Micromonospora sp. WMMD882]